MKPALRLIFHTPGLGGGGAERVFVLVANEMAARGHAVTMFVWNGEGPNAGMLDARVRLLSLGMKAEGGRFGKAATVKGLAGTVRMLRREKPDAVFSALDFANSLMAVALMAAGSKARYFPSYHSAQGLSGGGLADRLLPLLDRFTIRRATKAIGVSEGVSRDLEKRGFSRGDIVTIHNPVPHQARRSREPYPWERQLSEMGEGPVIATLGRLVPVKDHRTLIAAFHRLSQERACRLAIFGDGPLEEDLRGQVRTLGIQGRVLFAGYVNDPAACYAAADLVVLSSTTEGFGNVLVEAMAMGKPVVSTDAPHGPREILEGGEYGPLVPVGDVAALAQAMGRALDHPVAREKLVAHARNFDISAIGDAYEALAISGHIA